MDTPYDNSPPILEIRLGIMTHPGYPRLPYILRKIITDHAKDRNLCDQDLLLAVLSYLKYLYPAGFELQDTKDVDDFVPEGLNFSG